MSDSEKVPMAPTTDEPPKMPEQPPHEPIVVIPPNTNWMPRAPAETTPPLPIPQPFRPQPEEHT
jgi:hypothetical protein